MEAPRWIILPARFLLHSSRCGCLPALPTTVPGATGLVQRPVLLWRACPISQSGGPQPFLRRVPSHRLGRLFHTSGRYTRVAIANRWVGQLPRHAEHDRSDGYRATLSRSGRLPIASRAKQAAVMAMERKMPKETHTKAAEHHENAAKAHRTAAEHHGKGEHDKGHEESTKAHEHSTQAHRHSTDAHGKSGEHRTKK
jgi:hypothetical protein